jgi:hypothetical protein
MTGRMRVVSLAALSVFASIAMVGCTPAVAAPTGETPDPRLADLVALSVPSDLDFPGTGFTDLPAVAIGRASDFALLLRLRPGHCGVVSQDRDGVLSSLGVDAPVPGQAAVAMDAEQLPPQVAAAIGPAAAAAAHTANGDLVEYCGSRGMAVRLPAMKPLAVEGAAAALGDASDQVLVAGPADVISRATASPRPS